MTANNSISLPEELKNAIKEFNLKHPYEKLNISQIAQKAIYDKIKSLDNDILIDKKNQVIESKVLLLENDIQVDSTEKLCSFCKSSFTPISPKAKFCSDKCKSADYRKRKKSNN